MEIVFVFLFVDLFDNIGTLVAVGKEARLFDKTNQIPRINRILYCGRSRDHCWIAGRDVDRDELHRKRGGRRGGRTLGSNRDHHWCAVFVGPIRGAGGGSDTGRGHRASADRGGLPDDRACGRDPVVESRCFRFRRF